MTLPYLRLVRKNHRRRRGCPRSKALRDVPGGPPPPALPSLHGLAQQCEALRELLQERSDLLARLEYLLRHLDALGSSLPVQERDVELIYPLYQETEVELGLAYERLVAELMIVVSWMWEDVGRGV